KILPAVLAAVAMLCSLYVGPYKQKSNSTYDRARALLEVENKILTLEPGAAEALSAFEEKWEESDSTYGLHAYLSMIEGNAGEAYSWMNRYSDKSSKEYYLRMEALYLMDPAKTDPTDLYRLYEKAASDDLKWEYMQKSAGIACFEQGKNANAEFYLRNALAQDPEDPVTLYYLGAVSYMKGDIESADSYFRQSIGAGASDEMISWMAWYMNEAEGREE
ncbi:MAG: hypothetical protein J5744_08295, partial [Oscillospiraceae bacterium]|nr:hypothetical protein [Oscillospiraceae bacterium]